MPPLLSVQNIHLSLPGRPLIEAGNLVLSPGQRLGIMGASGTGKSSLALALLGLLPDGFSWSATCEWSGGPADFVALRGHAIGYIAQQPDLSFHPTLRLGRQLEDVLRTHVPRLSAKARTASIQELLTFVELPPRVLRAYVHELSGGELQRLAIVQTLLPRPRLILADEPTTALDPHTQNQVLALLRRATTAQGCALLTISHDPEVHALLDQPVALLEGRCLHAPASLSSLRQSYALPAAATAFQNPATEYPSEHPSRTPVLRLEGLAFGYTSRKSVWWGRKSIARDTSEPLLFEGLNAAVYAGETLGIIGASGAGKSTLLHLVAGVTLPQAGQVAYFDAQGLPTTLGALRRAGKIQWVFQHSAAALPPHLTVGSVLGDALRHAGRPRQDVSDLLSAVQLPIEYAQRLPHTLSGGEVQRVSLARALAFSPQLLLLDEPTAALDTETQSAIINLLKALQATHGMAYLWVSHQRHVIAQVADRVLEIE